MVFFGIINPRKQPIMNSILFKASFALLVISTLGSCGNSHEEKAASEQPESVGALKSDSAVPDATETVTPPKEVVEDPKSLKGIGPVKNVTIPDIIDDKLANNGQVIFEKNCKSCHQIDKRVVGPALSGVTEKRSPEWIMNMILNPEEMVAQDPIAQQLLAEYGSPMTKSDISEKDARALLEYFRKADKKK